MKRVLSLLIVFTIVLGIIGVPVSVSAKSKEEMVTVGGIIAPVSTKWTETLVYKGTATYDISGQDEGSFTTVFILSESVKSAEEFEKLAKVLSKKNSKAKVLKVLSNSELMEGSPITKKNLKLKKDAAGKYMAIVDFTQQGGSYYMVIRNIEDKYVAVYGAVSDDPVSSKLKKTVLGYAKRIEADPMGQTITLVDDLKVPFDESWTLLWNDKHWAELIAGTETEIELGSDVVDADEETMTVAELMKDDANKEELEALLIELLKIPVDELDQEVVDSMFIMEPDGNGAYYVAFNLVYGYMAFRIVDDKYMIAATAMNPSEVPLEQETIDKVNKMIFDAYIK